MADFCSVVSLMLGHTGFLRFRECCYQSFSSEHFLQLLIDPLIVLPYFQLDASILLSLPGRSDLLVCTDRSLFAVSFLRLMRSWLLAVFGLDSRTECLRSQIKIQNSQTKQCCRSERWYIVGTFEQVGKRAFEQVSYISQRVSPPLTVNGF